MICGCSGPGDWEACDDYLYECRACGWIGIDDRAPAEYDMAGALSAWFSSRTATEQPQSGESSEAMQEDAE